MEKSNDESLEWTLIQTQFDRGIDHGGKVTIRNVVE